MMTDPIADMLTRIRNAVRVEKQFVDLPFSNLKKNTAEVMKREGYIRDFQVVESQPANMNPYIYIMPMIHYILSMMLTGFLSKWHKLTDGT